MSAVLNCNGKKVRIGVLNKQMSAHFLICVAYSWSCLVSRAYPTLEEAKELGVGAHVGAAYYTRGHATVPPGLTRMLTATTLWSHVPAHS